MAVTPVFLVAAGSVVIKTDAVSMSGAEFSRDPLKSDGSLEL